jgi:hypothetical protein
MTPIAPGQIRLILDFEAVLQQLIVENQKMLKHVEAQQAAMKVLNLKAMDAATQLQEASRLRIHALEVKRRGLVQQMAKILRLQGEPKIGQLAEIFPHRKPALLKLRKDLKDLLEKLSARNNIAGRVAGAVLGHLNSAVRLFTGVVEHAGLYTRKGVPQSVPRIGMMEAVG